MMEFLDFINITRGEVISIIVVGIDLANHIFAVQGVNENGQPELIKPQQIIFKDKIKSVCRKGITPPDGGQESPAHGRVDVKRVGPAPGAPDQL